MGVRCGIVGLPNVGKTTVFNALTGAGAEVGNYPFTTIDKNVGVARVRDARLGVLRDVLGERQLVFAAIEFVDIAGLVKGASRGEGLGNRFLGHIRDVDLLVHVVRSFAAPEVAHVEPGLDAVRDVEIVDLEMVLADLESVDRRLDRVASLLKSGRGEAREEMNALRRLRQGLAAGTPARAVSLSPEEQAAVRSLNLLTAKPVIYVLNVAEDVLRRGADVWAARLREVAGSGPARVLVVAGLLEEQLAELGEEEAAEFRREFGSGESALDVLVATAYELLGLITFFTTNEEEIRAWPLPRGAVASQAAGRVHSDMERGFIRAEVVSFADLVKAGSFAAARETGALRVEGREYVVRDGDVMYFRFRI